MYAPSKTVFLLLLTSLSLAYFIPGTFLSIDAVAQEKDAAQKPAASSAKGKTVIDMTMEELRRSYASELRGVEFIQSQDELNPLLEKMGERVQAFFRDFSNTSSKEEVLLKRLGFADRQEDSMVRTYGYLILFNPDNASPLLQEYRTDKLFHAIDQEAIRGFFIASGYNCLSILFHPRYHQDSHFRYLGRQASEPRSHIIAFVQNPEYGRNLTKLTDINVDRSTRVPLQGIVWVDPVTYQIVRIRTSLVTGANSSFTTTQITDIQFGEIRFDSVPQKFWLPREVNFRMKIAGKTYTSLHRYSDYKLFSTNSDFKIVPPKSVK
jgi:hypothetical protein